MSMRMEFTCIPRDAKCVIESSSVWYDVFRFTRDHLVYEMIHSNPVQTKAIAASKKTNKVDAHMLADRFWQMVYTWNLKIPHNRVKSDRFYSSWVRPNIASWVWPVNTKGAACIWQLFWESHKPIHKRGSLTIRQTLLYCYRHTCLFRNSMVFHRSAQVARQDCHHFGSGIVEQVWQNETVPCE